MPRKGRNLEKLIKRIESAINTDDVKVESPGFLKDVDTGENREVDVVVRYLNQPHPFVIAIECRDREGNEDVTWIEQLIQKRASLVVDKVIAVSSTGFSEGAIKKAEKHGIKTLNLLHLPDDLEQVILSKVMVIQHLNVEAEKVLVLLNVQHENLLEQFREETKEKNINEVKLYKNDHSLWGTVGQLLPKHIPQSVYDSVEEGEKVVKGLNLNFTNPHDCFFAKIGNEYARIDKIEAIVHCFWIQEEAVFDTTYLSDAADNRNVIAKHAETTFAYQDKKVTFSLTKRDDTTLARVEVTD
ncbi:MAG TPA: restriction endonuclease [Patescibacteria group bacterium]